MTVSDMFADIAKYNLHEICGPNGCHCDGHYNIRAVYDNKFGYPRNLVHGMERPHLMTSFSDYLAASGCTLVGIIHRPSMNITLKPL